MQGVVLLIFFGILYYLAYGYFRAIRQFVAVSLGSNQFSALKIFTDTPNAYWLMSDPSFFIVLVSGAYMDRISDKAMINALNQARKYILMQAVLSVCIMVVVGLFF